MRLAGCAVQSRSFFADEPTGNRRRCKFISGWVSCALAIVRPRSVPVPLIGAPAVSQVQGSRSDVGWPVTGTGRAAHRHSRDRARVGPRDLA